MGLTAWLYIWLSNIGFTVSSVRPWSMSWSDERSTFSSSQPYCNLLLHCPSTRFTASFFSVSLFLFLWVVCTCHGATSRVVRCSWCSLHDARASSLWLYEIFANTQIVIDYVVGNSFFQKFRMLLAAEQLPYIRAGFERRACLVSFCLCQQKNGGTGHRLIYDWLTSYTSDWRASDE